MDPNKPALNMSNEYNILVEMTKDINLRDQISPTKLLEVISKELDKEFQNAVPTMDNVDITTPAGSLNIPRTPSATMALTIATEVSNYWSMAVATSGTPQGCKAIVSVTNDAPKIIPLLTASIMGIYDGTAKLPQFLDFCTVIIDAVKTIIWTVNEADGTGCSTTFTVTVS